MGEVLRSAQPHRRTHPRSSQSADADERLPWSKAFRLQLLRTPLLGWVGFAGRDGRVVAISLGHASPAELRSSLVEMVTADPQLSTDAGEQNAVEEADWNPAFADLLQAYSAGRSVDFSLVPVVWPQVPPFHDRVLRIVQRISAGETRSYAAVAREAGSPGAARAVGNCMRSNRLPLLIPCHRVIASNGGLGGFSAPRGTDLKAELLAHEATLRCRPLGWTKGSD